MKIQNYLFAAALMGITALSSCKKDDDNNTTPASGNLAAGKGVITFNTNADFGGSNTYNPGTLVISSATRTASTGYDQITLQTSELNGTTVRSGGLIIEVPNNASTTGGNLTGDFSMPDKATIIPILTISVSNGTTGGTTAYGSDAGKITITKLTDTEVEGTFNANVSDGQTSPKQLTVTNGTFAGKFK